MSLSYALNWVDKQQSRMQQLLQEWCRINSGSDNMEGLALMAQRLAECFAVLGGSLQTVALPPRTAIDDSGQLISIPSAHALHMSKRPEAPLKIFLGGHMDTVYAQQHPFQTTDRLPGNILRGPGAADMKGGLVVLLTALQAFEQYQDAPNIGWELFINPDEETGSTSSREFLMQCAKKTSLGLLF